jgi:hypothetical protein
MVKAVSKNLGTAKIPTASYDAMVKAVSKNLGTAKIPTATLRVGLESFAEIKMPSISRATADSILSAFVDLSDPSRLEALKADWEAHDPGRTSITPLQVAASAVTAASLDDDNEDVPDSQMASDIIGTILVLLAFWMVYCVSPELQRIVGFFEFPLTFAGFVWTAVHRRNVN